MKMTKFGKKSFRYAAPVLWSSLPENLEILLILISLNLLCLDGMVRTVTAPLAKST